MQQQQQQQNTFILKYRPYFINDFYLEDSHITVLKTLQELNDLNILIVGNPCSGKTSLVYAIIREYYGMNETAVFPEYNITFINNLKEQGIQYFRNEMKTFSQSNCSIFGKKKIIVVDDIDNVPKQSQQVFRNCIDKYKSNVQFISSCSNTQKVVESLQSRLHIIRLTPPTKKQMELVCENIVKREIIQMDEESKSYLIERSNGSIRNVINNLEKMKIFGNEDIIISENTTRQLCSNISFCKFDEYIRWLTSGNLREAIRTINDVYDYGYSVIDILEYMFVFVKQTELLTEDQKYAIIPHICEFITIFHNFHEHPIELAILSGKICDALKHS